MKISILDQSPISVGKTAEQALKESLKLAQIGEELGYTRYWITEHHNIPGLSCSSPEVMLSYIGAHTNRIRLGSGAVLLPYYKPYKVAEIYNMLSVLYPNRIDLGNGRGPGGSDKAKLALSDNYSEQVRSVPESIVELLHFLKNDFPTNHKYNGISAFPLPNIPPQPWILGTSIKSAKIAAANGLPYVFGHFISDIDGLKILETYRQAFKRNNQLKHPKTIIAVSAICSETKEKAEEIALGELFWNILISKGEGNNGIPSIEEAKQYQFTVEEKETIKNMEARMIIGTPMEVKEKIVELQSLYQSDEIMIKTNTHYLNDRVKSYQLLAEELLTNN